MKASKVGVDSYSLKPLGLSPFELLEWAIINGADGVQFSEGGFPASKAPDKPLLEDLRTYAAENGLYLEWGGGEHIPLDLATGKKKDILAVNRRAAAEAVLVGATSVRSCSGGLMRWKKDSPPTGELLRLSAAALRGARPMLRDHGLTLAVETHFEFTSFELLRLFEMSGAAPGGEIGVCLDTMNVLVMLEDPESAAARLLPWVVTTHIKDGGLLVTEDGLVAFPAEAGTGAVDLPAVIVRLRSLPRQVNLSLEDHGGDFLVPVYDAEFLAGFPDLSVGEMAKLLRTAARTRTAKEAGRMGILDRARWPEVCERRVRRGLQAVRRIAEKGTG
ncbi:MAG TPA: TIM barrel protein [Terriglobales bacterium]|nr:TIM barrel protein [Terriglobales bacterium]